MEIRNQLHDEWDELRWQLVDWHGQHMTLGAWHAMIRREPDPTLAALLGLVSSDLQAGRVIVQALLPKLLRMAARDRQAELGDYVSHLWLRLMSYPLDRRPRGIAANLVLDTLKAVAADREPTPPATPMPICGGGDGLSAAGVVDFARRLRVVTPATADVLHSVYVEELPTREAAAKHGITVAALRARCSHATRTLARHRLAMIA